MALTRRGMLGAIGGATVGGKRAIGKVADVAMNAGNPDLSNYMKGARSGYLDGGIPGRAREMSMLDVRGVLGGWPDWWLDEQRRYAKGDVRPLGIDADIDALKSVSRVGKFQMQVERNFQNRIAEPEKRAIVRKARESILKSFGIDWIVDE